MHDLDLHHFQDAEKKNSDLGWLRGEGVSSRAVKPGLKVRSGFNGEVPRSLLDLASLEVGREKKSPRRNVPLSSHHVGEIGQHLMFQVPNCHGDRWCTV